MQSDANYTSVILIGKEKKGEEKNVELARDLPILVDITVAKKCRDIEGRISQGLL